VDRPRGYEVRLGSEATTDTVQNGFQVGREDERIIRNSFLICITAGLTQNLSLYRIKIKGKGTYK
jgi:hypothetical protein